MTDIAEIGFSVNTSDLDKTVVKLNAIKPAAAGVSASAQQVATAVEGASAAISTASLAVAKAEQSKADAMLKSARATSSSSQADIQAAVSAKLHADAAYAAAKAERDKTLAATASTAASNKTVAAALAVAAAYKQQTAAARAAFNAAAAGASGPQAMPGMAQQPNSANMNNRFYSANILAQFHDIGVTAAMGMNPMTIAVQQGTQLVQILKMMPNPLQGIKDGFKAMFGVMEFGVIATIAIIAALVQFVNWTKVAKVGLTAFANALQTAGPYVLALAATLALIYSPTIIRGLATVTASIVRIGLAAVVSGAQMAAAWIVAAGPIAWIIAGIALLIGSLELLSKKFHSVFATEVLAAIKDTVNESIGLFIGFFAGIVAAAKNLPDQLRGKGMSAGEAFSKGFNDAMGKDYVGKVAGAVGTELDTLANKIRKYAAALGENTKKWQEVIRDSQRRLETLKAENKELGLSAIAAAELKYQTELLNDAKEKNIKLTPQQTAQLKQMGAAMGKLSEDTRKTKEAMDFAKEGTKGFVSDLRTGLKEGESLWKSFGNAVTNVLNKILDKLIDVSIDKMFEGSGGGSSSGGAGGLTGMLTSAAKWLFSAKGNAFNAANDNGLIPFAKGGVVSRPTMFAFGQGGQFGGVMGEKGPEAILPLSRGPDGSLGVKMQGNGNNSGSGNVEINIINNNGSTVTQTKRQTSSGLQIDVMIDDTVASKVGQNGSSTNRALQARDSRKLIRR